MSPLGSSQRPEDFIPGPAKLESSTAVVYLEYDDASALPPKPSSAWTRFVCISDTHSRTFPVPPGDVLLHSGDLTETGKFTQFRETMDWLCSLPHAHKIVIAGNHDLPLHVGWYDDNYKRWHGRNGKEPLEPILQLLKGPAAIDAGIVYLQDETYEFSTKEGGRLWSVYGSPWSPEFYNWAFNYQRGLEAERVIRSVPTTDILLTHGPPYNILDDTLKKQHVGCEELAARLPTLRPRLHLFGHIHEAHGAAIREWIPKPCIVEETLQEAVARADECATSDSPSQPRAAHAISFTSDATVGDVPPTEGDEPGRGRTVFVNAANWPAGPQAWRVGKVEFGGPGFRPVVVDLLDHV